MTKAVPGVGLLRRLAASRLAALSTVASAGWLALAGLLATEGAMAADSSAPSPVAARLRDGYEVKAAFPDNNGGAYMVLQKGTSAYLCHSNPNPNCEKLN